MAQYTINYACGHGTHTVVLFGKESERDKRMKWMESNMECPDCYHTKLRKYGIRLITDTTYSGSEPYILLLLVGDTYSIKDTIKSLGGYHFDYYDEKKWQKQIKQDDLDAEIDTLKNLGVKVDEYDIADVNSGRFDRGDVDRNKKWIIKIKEILSISTNYIDVNIDNYDQFRNFFSAFRKIMVKTHTKPKKMLCNYKDCILYMQFSQTFRKEYRKKLKMMHWQITIQQ